MDRLLLMKSTNLDEGGETIPNLNVQPANEEEFFLTGLVGGGIAIGQGQGINLDRNINFEGHDNPFDLNLQAFYQPDEDHCE